MQIHNYNAHIRLGNPVFVSYHCNTKKNKMSIIKTAIFVDRDETEIAKYPLWFLRELEGKHSELNIFVGKKFDLAKGSLMVTQITVENSILKLRCARIPKKQL